MGPAFEERAELGGAGFARQATFSGLRFEPGADFAGCRFDGVARFAGAQFYGPTRFTSAIFNSSAASRYGARRRNQLLPELLAHLECERLEPLHDSRNAAQPPRQSERAGAP
jgi:hypothetical protein